jgi:Skp family chaperone for outer membrane proteins
MRTSWIARVGLMAVGMVFASSLALAEGPKIGVINLSVAFDKYRLTKDLEAKFDEKRRELADEADRRKAEIDVKREALASFKPDSADYKERRDQITELEVQFQVWAGVKDQQLKDSHKEWLLHIYTDIRAAVKKVAQEQGVDLVLTFEDVTEDAPDSKALRQQLLLEKVIYFDTRLDLTEAVLKQVNSSYGGPDTIQLGLGASRSETTSRPEKRVADVNP